MEQVHVFGVPLGCDFVQVLARGFYDRTQNMQPHEVAQIRIFVNTARMKRRLLQVFDEGPSCLLPRVELLSDLSSDLGALDVEPAVAPLRRRFEIAQFVQALLQKEPDLAPESALYGLSDSLARLMDEMKSEGVSPEALSQLDISDQSGHWERALQFLSIITPYFGARQAALDVNGRQRLIVETFDQLWETTPPTSPVWIAGSTGSRGTTALLMRRVARMKQGAVILPGFDFDMPHDVWRQMVEMSTGEDHPQSRYAQLMQSLEMEADGVLPWVQSASPSHPKRNALLSLALRPAPVTSQWLKEGPFLGDLRGSVEDITLLEVDSPKEEAEIIALRLRLALDEGRTAALISPDRMLTRQVAAALGRWGLVPDDSAGVPLSQSAIGRLFRHVLALMSEPLTSESLLVLLKHPLCQSQLSDEGGYEGARGVHLLLVRELELYFRSEGIAFPCFEDVDNWISQSKRIEHVEHKKTWLNWLSFVFFAYDMQESSEDSAMSLSAFMERFLALVKKVLSVAHTSSGSLWDGQVWQDRIGRDARIVCENILEHADVLTHLNVRDFSALVSSIFSQHMVRLVDESHPQLLIWGTLEARVQGADLVILGGLNEGVWPEHLELDPWLNRAMRAKLGLLLPERKVGLSAHDFQQAVSLGEVWITRAKRGGEAQTIPSRWLNRLTNLLEGLPDQHGPEALAQMRGRCVEIQAQAKSLSRCKEEQPSYNRPSPCPPLNARPKQISVTQIKTLIRDPYAIYAKKVLRLRSIDPLLPAPSAALRGNIIHDILETFSLLRLDASQNEARDALLKIARETFLQSCPWPYVRESWTLRFEGNVDAFLQSEVARQQQGHLKATESWGEMLLPNHGVKVSCKSDRFDLNETGGVLVYDYKTGVMPTKKQQLVFDKQLLVTGAMVERGAFDALGPRKVERAAFVGVGTHIKEEAAPFNKTSTQNVWDDLQLHFDHWQVLEHGYSARRAMQKNDDKSDYDHLSRFGEWKVTDAPVCEILQDQGETS